MGKRLKKFKFDISSCDYCQIVTQRANKLIAENKPFVLAFEFLQHDKTLHIFLKDNIPVVIKPPRSHHGISRLTNKRY